MLASSLIVSCGKKAEEQAKVEPVKVKEMIVGEGGLAADGSQVNAMGMASASAYYSGTVEEENGVSLSFSTGGIIKQLHVKVGDHVRRGQFIADPITRSYSVKIRVEGAADGLLPGMVSNERGIWRFTYQEEINSKKKKYHTYAIAYFLEKE